MSRLVKLKPNPNSGSTASLTSQQTYLDQVVKYIPAEIIGGYVAINGFLASLPADMLYTWLWINLGFCALMTILYFYKLSKPGDATVAQLIISFISFFIWAYSITGDGGVFGKGGINIYYSQLASGLLVAFTLIAPFFTPKEPL